MLVANFVSALRKGADLIDWETDDTKAGCTVRRTNWSTDRYLVDFADDFNSEGWLQFDTDQDAHYFGVWVNPKQFLTLSYCEGDWTLVECHDADRYRECVQRMCDFYGEGRIALVISPSGRATEFRQDRSQFVV